MGSSGSGRFSDYSGSKPIEPDANNGGSSQIDKCTMAFATKLEDVNRCFYFISHGMVPPIGTPVKITFNGVRLGAETMIGEEIGYLPTTFNYLKNCIDSSFRYEGVIRAIGVTPIADVFIDVQPI